MIKENIKKEQMEVLHSYGMGNCNLEHLVQITYESGEFLCMEGYNMKYLLVLLHGKAKVSITTADGKVLLLCFYMSGGIFGDVELMMDTPETKSNVQAVTRVTCIGIPLDVNKERLKGNLEFMNYVAGSLARKLDRSSKNSAFTILHTLESRLCSYILLASEQDIFQEKLTEVAELLGTSYRHLLRTLEQLCKQDILRKEQCGYRIVNMQLVKQRGDEYYMPYESAYIQGRKNESVKKTN